jgi:hypothetical protein
MIQFELFLNYQLQFPPTPPSPIQYQKILINNACSCSCLQSLEESTAAMSSTHSPFPLVQEKQDRLFAYLQSANANTESVKVAILLQLDICKRFHNIPAMLEVSNRFLNKLYVLYSSKLMSELINMN